MEGIGRWFDTQEQAYSYALEKKREGARSFDVGCFQINYRWHGDQFASLREMFDPEANAIYAANFLKKLFAETGDWREAAGAYHSRTEEHAAKYRSRFSRIYAQVSANPPWDTGGDTDEIRLAMLQPRRNNYPLLQTGARKSQLGSLVPLSEGAVSDAGLFATTGGGDAE